MWLNGHGVDFVVNLAIDGKIEIVWYIMGVACGLVCVFFTCPLIGYCLGGPGLYWN